jgi:hypothetical protein
MLVLVVQIVVLIIANVVVTITARWTRCELVDGFVWVAWLANGVAKLYRQSIIR